MKKHFILALCVGAAVALTSCKSRESAYRQAYEQAMLQDKNNQSEQQVATTPVTSGTTNVTTIVQPSTTPTTTVVDHSDVREIKGEMSVVSGSPLKTYSVVVGSFVTEANAVDQKNRLQGEGHDSRVVKTNETINGHTGWFRVIASSYDDKASAAQSRDALRGSYPGAWLLYRK